MDPTPLAPPPSRLVARNFLTLGAGEMVARLIGFAGTIYIARQLGVEAYGVIGFGFALMMYATAVTDLGLEQIGPREIVEHRGSLDPLVGSVLITRLAVSAVMSIVLALVGTLLLTQPEGNVLALFGLMLIAAGANTKWVHVGFDRSGVVSVTRLISETVKLLILIGFVGDTGDLLIVPLAYGLGEVLGSVLLISALRRHGVKLRPRFDAQIVRDVLARARPLLAANVLSLLVYNADVVLLRIFRGRVDVGLYLAAYTLINFLGVLSNITTLSLVPSFSRLRTAEPERRELFRTSMVRSFGVGMPMAVGGALLAGAILDLVFGPAYAASAAALRILIWSIPVLLLRSVLQALLISAGRQDRVLRTTAWAAGVNVGLNLVVVPLYGFVGAAVTTVLAEVIRFVIAQRYVSEAGIAPISPLRYWRPAAAAAGMAVLLVLTKPDAVLVAVALGGVAYAALLALLSLPHARPRHP